MTVTYIVVYPHPDIFPEDSIQPIRLDSEASGKDILNNLTACFPKHAADLKGATLWKASNLATASVNITSREPIREWIHQREREGPIEKYELLREHFPDSPKIPDGEMVQIVVVTQEALVDADYIGGTDRNDWRMRERLKVAKELREDPSPSDSIKDHSAVGTTVSGPNGPRYGRPSFRFGPPTALFNEALALLKYDLEHLDKLTPARTYMDPAFRLVITATSFPYDKDEWRDSLLRDMTFFLGRGVKWRALIANGTATPDGVLLEGSFACMILELQNEPGLGGDPFLRSLIVYKKIISHARLSSILRTNFPAVLLSMAGNCLVVSTAIYTDAVYADKLLSIDLHLGPHGPNNVLRVARVFMAIRKCTEKLCRYYSDLETLSGMHPSVMYPSPTADPPENQIQIPQLEFFAKVDRTSGTQLAIVDEDNERHAVYLARRTCTSIDGTSVEVVLVKFTAEYGESAHRLLAEQDPPLAPALYSCNRVIGGLHMVVMEYLSNASPLHRFFPPSPVPYSLKPEVVHENLKKALRLLHGQSFVFGDLREPNVLYSHEGDRVFLVDFDWVGKDQESRYSPCLNPDVQYGVERWQIMEKAHDNANLERLMERLSSTSRSR